MKQPPQRQERRWIVLGDDGRHATLGRHTDPLSEAIDRAGAMLRAAGQGGWLAVTEGQYYGPGSLSVLMVREIAPVRRPWKEVVALFHQARSRAISEPTP